MFFEKELRPIMREFDVHNDRLSVESVACEAPSIKTPDAEKLGAHLPTALSVQRRAAAKKLEF